MNILLTRNFIFQNTLETTRENICRDVETTKNEGREAVRATVPREKKKRTEFLFIFVTKQFFLNYFLGVKKTTRVAEK